MADSTGAQNVSEEGAIDPGASEEPSETVLRPETGFESGDQAEALGDLGATTITNEVFFDEMTTYDQAVEEDEMVGEYVEEFEDEDGGLVAEEDWGEFGGEQEEEWGFDAAPAVAQVEDPMVVWQTILESEAINLLGANWRETMSGSSQTSSEKWQAPPELWNDTTWQAELPEVRWEDTDMYRRFHATLKGLLGGHRAALLAAVTQQTDHNEAVDDPAPTPLRSARRKHMQPLSPDDKSNPFS